MNRSQQSNTDGSQAAANAGSLRLEGRHRYSVARFLIALVLLLIAMPFVDQLDSGKLIEAALMTLVLLSGVLAVGGRRRTLITAAVLVIPAVVGRWLDHFYSGTSPRAITTLAAILFMTFITAHLIRFILLAPRVNSEVLCAGIAGFLMVGIIWAMGYVLLARIRPDSFAFSDGAHGGTMDSFNAVYFSFVSLSTLGFGEVTPLSRTARMFAVLEALFGMFYMAILIARLVSLYSTEPTKNAKTEHPVDG